MMEAKQIELKTISLERINDENILKAEEDEFENL